MSKMKQTIFIGDFKEVCEKSKEIESLHTIRMEGLISPEEYNNKDKNDETDYTVFEKKVAPFKDDEKFGCYCKFTVSIMRKDFKEVAIIIHIKDPTRKQFSKKPLHFMALPEQNCVLFEWAGEGFYDCNRTYFHFDDDDENETGENDFMHYKCKLIKMYIVQ